METKRVQEVVHTLRQKPLHVRENIALGLAGGATLLVALGWFGVAAISGTFSLAPTPTTLATDNTNTEQPAASSDGFSQLLGAAGAALGASSSPASITIVDTQVHSTLDEQTVPPDATVIHF